MIEIERKSRNRGDLVALKKKQEEFIMYLMESNTNDEAINKAGISQSNRIQITFCDSDFQANTNN